jgi:DNA-binding beta-propeller fold protein YncE
VRGVRWGIRVALLSVGLVLALPGSALAFGPLSSFGAFGHGAGQLDEPNSVAIGPDGSSYVVEYGAQRVSEFAADGSFVRAFGKDVNLKGGDICTADSGCGEGLADDSAGGMFEPEGAAFGPEGNLFVSDSGNARIDVYTAAGTFLYAFGKAVNTGAGDADVCTAECQDGESGAGAGEMNGPGGIDFDPGSALLYVADYGNRRIDVFEAGGGFVKALGKEVKSGGPGNVCTELTGCQAGASNESAGALVEAYDVAAAPDGRIAVADAGNRRIDVFSTGGAFIFGAGREVELGGAGDVCTEAAGGCEAGQAGAAAGGFESVSGVAADVDGNLYASDYSNNRVSEFGPGGSFIRAFGEGVLDGNPEFQICTADGACQTGGNGTIPGATPEPYGLTVDCRGAIFVTEQEVGFSRVERFGEAGTAAPPCPEAEEIAAVHPVLRAAPAPLPVLPANRFKFGRVKLDKRKGTGRLFVKVPGPGKLLLRGGGVRRARRHAGKAGIVGMPVAAVGGKKRHLRRHHRVKLQIKVTFTPTGGRPFTRSTKVHLKRRHD